MIKVRKVLCYFSGLVLTLAGIPFITEFIFESQGGQQVQYISIYPVIGGILMGFGILVCYLAYRSGNKAEILLNEVGKGACKSLACVLKARVISPEIAIFK